MSGIDVEAVDDIGADGAEYVLYGGKGGVGKTTMAAATALASAADGVDTLVVSTDPAHSLSDAFETEVPAEPAELREGLYAAEIDPGAAMADAPMFDEEGGVAGLGGLGDLLGGSDDGAAPGAVVPGADEAAAMQQLLRYLDDERFERVIVDTAPTGHTLRLLELPDAMDSMVGRILSLRERLSGLAGSIGGPFGDDESSEDDLDDLRALRERIERLRSTVRDPVRTDFRIVMVPEGMSVTESRRLRERVEGFDIPVGTVVVNRVMEPLSDVADTDAETVSPDLDSCEFCRRRWRVQREAIREAQELFRGHDVKRVPLFADEVRGEPALRLVAACLAG